MVFRIVYGESQLYHVAAISIRFLGQRLAQGVCLPSLQKNYYPLLKNYDAKRHACSKEQKNPRRSTAPPGNFSFILKPVKKLEKLFIWNQYQISFRETFWFVQGKPFARSVVNAARPQPLYLSPPFQAPAPVADTFSIQEHLAILYWGCQLIQETNRITVYPFTYNANG